MKVWILLKDEFVTELTPEITEKAYREYCVTKQSASKLDMYRWLDHIRWPRFYTYYNWGYGTTRDETARQHPMLCPYTELIPTQKRERDAAWWELLGNIASKLGKR